MGIASPGSKKGQLEELHCVYYFGLISGMFMSLSLPAFMVTNQTLYQYQYGSLTDKTLENVTIIWPLQLWVASNIHIILSPGRQCYYLVTSQFYQNMTQELGQIIFQQFKML